MKCYKCGTIVNVRGFDSHARFVCGNCVPVPKESEDQKKQREAKEKLGKKVSRKIHIPNP